MKYIDHTNYYGYDFSERQCVFELFCSADKSCFVAICHMKKDRLADQYPVYYFDLVNGTTLCVGNFRSTFCIENV